MHDEIEALHPHPDVVEAELDGMETVLLHLETKRYFSLNATGTRIWRGLKQHWTLDAISARLQDEFDVDAEHAAASIVALVRDLEQNGLVIPATNAAVSGQ